MKAANGSAAVIILGLLVAGCIVDGAIRPTLDQPTGPQIVRLWQERLETTTLDLFHGPGGEALMPETTTPFTFIRADTSGYSAGYDVRGPDGTEWSVKLGPEAQPEVAVSRILWALGFTSRRHITWPHGRWWASNLD